MLLQNEREEIVRFGRKMVSARLTSGTGGNLSVIDRDAGLVAISPSGMEYDETEPADVPVLDLDGVAVTGERKPSSEFGFHLALYHARPDIGAVVHTHSVYATTMACLGWEIPAVHYLVAFSGHKVPLAPYATFGSRELADSVAGSIGEHNALLLANHGLVAVGPNLATAFAVAEEIELVAQIYYQAKCIGEPVMVPQDEMERVIGKFAVYGQRGTTGSGAGGVNKFDAAGQNREEVH
ncbi:L-fuculose-phosphate aldolase [Pelobacter propionicus]|uniref:L-fuculose 1-phosphate aldolase n=1 Tax=Pelobacter propionicus (strain DSM 2379 / NBRC 103807 / OttBd1) TaxID=338966 RepID=A1AS27_PELPD|nr:L-fuculose-phosphate aldolase [Pelobacter propionicus]ABL00148.1 L-fuculose 1-phosphate aldolase [Pelobacter propionicus DSM 2379]